MGLEDVAGQRLVPGGHAADGPGFEHAVAARRDEPAVQRFGRHPADRPDPETVLEFVDASDHQRRAGSSRAAKKSRRRRQYPVRAPQSRDLGPQTLRLRHRVLGRLPGLRRDHGVRLVAPTPQCLRRDLRIPGDLFDRLGLRRIRAARLGQQPDGLRLELRRVSRAFCHGSIISHRVRGNAEQKSVHITILAKRDHKPSHMTLLYIQNSENVTIEARR